MLRAGLPLVLLCFVASTALAQAPKSIDPGMSQAKVVERLGQPDLSRASGDFKYLFYHNDCGKQCGVDDVVILQKDSVVDALFRSVERSYSGKSSSPRSIPADVAARTRRRAPDVPSDQVVQAGSPRPDSTPAKADTTPAKADTTPAKVDSTPKPPKHKPVSKPEATNADTTHRDTVVNGTLRIPVKPQHHSMKPDSARADTAKKAP